METFRYYDLTGVEIESRDSVLPCALACFGLLWLALAGFGLDLAWPLMGALGGEFQHAASVLHR